jgi:surface polysaccharide O-acyltransferase-like enzyme
VNVPAEKARSIQYINRLRILAIYAVVTAHVAMGLTMRMRPFTTNWWLGCWLFYIAHAAIPIFVMISGALLLGNERQESAMEFYKRRLYRAGIPLVFWTIIYLIVRQVVDGEHLTTRSIAALILTGDPYYHLWFLYMIAGLYLVTPVLRTFVRLASQRDRLFVIVVILLLANVYFQTDVLLWNNHRSIFTMFIPFIGYYLCGYELRLIDPKKIPTGFPSLTVMVSAIYLVAFAPVFLDRQGGVGVRYLFDFFSLPMVFLSIAIFWAAYLHDTTARPPDGFRKRAVEWVASTTLGIYVLHPLVLTCIKDRLGNHAGDGPFWLAVIVVPLATFIACYLITSVMMNIPLLRRTVS